MEPFFRIIFLGIGCLFFPTTFNSPSAVSLYMIPFFMKVISNPNALDVRIAFLEASLAALIKMADSDERLFLDFDFLTVLSILILLQL